MFQLFVDFGILDEALVDLGEFLDVFIGMLGGRAEEFEDDRFPIDTRGDVE